MQIPWLSRPPTAEEVAAHAKAYPLSPSRAPTGRWLFVRDDGVAYFVMLMVGLRPEVLREYEQGARWLPCTAEGIPVCFVDRNKDPESKARRIQQRRLAKAKF